MILAVMNANLTPWRIEGRGEWKVGRGKVEGRGRSKMEGREDQQQGAMPCGLVKAEMEEGADLK